MKMGVIEVKKLVKNKLLTKKTKSENEYWTNWLGMDELDRERYVSRLVPVIKRALDEERKTQPKLLGVSVTSLLNNYFQDLERTINMHHQGFLKSVSEKEKKQVRGKKDEPSKRSKK